MLNGSGVIKEVRNRPWNYMYIMIEVLGLTWVMTV